MFSSSGAGARHSERGFTLLELMIAMICTVLVVGAVLAMMLAGNNAFRREPALADRQQNVRTAMELIQRDLSSAGSDMDGWVQAFMRDELDGSLLNGHGPMGPDGVPSDYLLIIGNTGECPSIPVEPNPGGGGGGGVVLRPQRPLPACYDTPTLLFVQGGPTAPPPGYVIGFACDPTSPGIVNFPSGQDRDHNLPGGGGLPDPSVAMKPMQAVKYIIRIDPPPIGDGQTPNLWRSPTGGFNSGGTCGVGGGGATPPTDGYQLVARGIEDMQVVYILADAPAPGGTRVNTPPVVVEGTTGTLVREVEVTLTARALEANLQGATDPAAAAAAANVPRAVRSHLRSVTSPRAALLSMGTQSPPAWR